jgi:hypothetical protein
LDLFKMKRLNPEKLHTTCTTGTTPEELVLPRRYTLTHSDRTGELFLTTGREYNKHQISMIYTRLMRDEVLAEFLINGHNLEFNVYCHVSGGFAIGPAKWRNDIFHSELPLVLEAFRYGDRVLFEEHPELDNTPVWVHFISSSSRFNKVENWGNMGKFR